MCGLRRAEDIEAANRLMPEYIGFVFAPASRRYIAPEEAAALRQRVRPGIRAVGVFVDAKESAAARLLAEGVIDIAQLHGNEDGAYIARLKARTGKPVIRAFRVKNAEDLRAAEASPADMILLDAGAGDGKTFDWSMLSSVSRPYFLAGGLTPENTAEAVKRYHPFAVDVSSGIETDGFKDCNKMRAFMRAVREGDSE
jgi:phosphoribosylanthranilate isomerase